MIYIVGLGSGEINDITYGTYKLLTTADLIYLRTSKHPLVEELEKNGMKYKSFDSYYNKYDTFEEVYQNICDDVLANSKYSNLIYAVPGNPLVAEKSVTLLIDKLKKNNVPYKILPAVSFLDAMFSSLEFDPSEGFLLLDALSLKKDDLSSKDNIIITQVYDNYIASDIKLLLLEYYEDDALITLINSAGIEGEEQILEVKIEDMDRISWDYNHLTSLFIKKGQNKRYYSLDDLENLISLLRSEDGCPWDREQDKFTLVPYFKEESEELIEAINNDDIDNIIEELGDVLLHIVFQAQIGKEEYLFDINEVIDGIVKKMKRRHPHVFGDTEAKTLKDVNEIWNIVKKQEKCNKFLINKP